MRDLHKKKLQLGILLDSYEVPSWIYTMLKKILQSEYAEINLIILNDSAYQKNRLESRIKTDLDFLLYRFYKKLDEKYFPSNPNPFETKNIKKIIGNLESLKIYPKQINDLDLFNEQDINKINNFSLDVLIKLGFGTLKGKILKTSKFGMWSFQHGNLDVRSDLPSGFWEVMNKQPLTGSFLQILRDESDSGQILYKSYSRTDPCSVKRNLDKIVWKSLSFLPRKLKELYEIGDEEFFIRLNGHSDFDSYDKKLFPPPTNRKMLKPIFTLSGRITKSLFNHSMFFDQWILLFDLDQEIKYSLERFKKIIPPKDRFWGDPHVIYKNDHYYIFFEEFFYNSKKGHISLIIMDEQGNYTKPEKILEKPYHLSYPFVFFYKDDYYMIPESSANNTIELYKCVDFPKRWKFYKNIMNNLFALDTTLFYYKNKWWLFTNIVENEGGPTSEELFLFYSDNLLGDSWIPHPQNPIVSNIENGRPAGKIFEHNGKLLRPSQNSTYWYGYGLNFNKIETLDENHYQELPLNSIEPRWDKKIRSVHTFNHENGLTIVDAQLRRFRAF